MNINWEEFRHYIFKSILLFVPLVTLGYFALSLALGEGIKEAFYSLTHQNMYHLILGIGIYYIIVISSYFFGHRKRRNNDARSA